MTSSQVTRLGEWYSCEVIDSINKPACDGLSILLYDGMRPRFCWLVGWLDATIIFGFVNYCSTSTLEFQGCTNFCVVSTIPYVPGMVQ